MIARLVVGMLALFVCGIMVGVTLTLATYDANGSMPDCQEDEYLYPLDYVGPGENEPSSYLCWNFDDSHHD